MSTPSSSRLLRLFISSSTHTPLCERCAHRTVFNSRFYHSIRPTYTSLTTRASLRRTFTSTHAPRAALASHPPADPTVLLSYPSPSAIQEDTEDEADVEYVPPEEARIEVTERAAEQLKAIAKREDNPDAALRVAVESGGCHGYQYKMELAKSRESDDYHFTHPRITPANIYVDAVSMGLLNGSTIDFATELIGSSFRILDNPHAKGSGCGCGVSWELKV